MKGFLYFSAYNNIAETMRLDCACGRVSFGNPGACAGSLGTASMEARATPELFILAARQYLATAGARVCTVECYDPAYTDWTCGFTTRRDGDYLHVIEALRDERLAPGMRIVAVGKNTIPFLLKDTPADIFWGRGGDREDWDLALRMYDDIDVFPGDGHVMRLDVQKYPVETPPIPTLVVKRLRDDAVLLRIDSLEDVDAIENLVGEFACVVSEGDHLVLDLRHCEGEGDTEAYLALMPWLIDEDIAASKLMPARRLWTLYTKANAERLRAALEPARATNPELVDALVSDIDEKAANVLAAIRSTLDPAERRHVAEVAEEIPSPCTNEVIYRAPHAPCDVRVLVDRTTGAGAERLVETVLNQKNVAVVGRASSGASDYTNMLTIDYSDIMCRFTYPMSRSDANHEGAGFARTGVPLDMHVPWTAQECTRDLVLEAALAL